MVRATFSLAKRTFPTRRHSWQSANADGRDLLHRQRERKCEERAKDNCMMNRKWLVIGLCASVLLPGAVVQAQEITRGAAGGAAVGAIGGAIAGDAGKGAAAGAAAGAMVGGMRKYDRATGTEGQ